MLQLARYLYFGLALYVCYEIIRISFNYYDPNFSRGFLIGKEAIWPFYKFALYLHIVFAPLAFLLTIPQILFPNSKSHRIIGKTYVFAVLFLAGPSGFVMSFWALGGNLGIGLFLTLSILWLFYTYQALNWAKKGNILLHRRFAIGSFILCNSAILLRLFHYVNLKMEILPPQNSYIVMSFLSWVPFLILHELLFMRRRKNIV